VSKKNLARCLAVLLCLGLLAVAVPNLSSAAKSTAKMSFTRILAQPALAILSLVPALGPSAMSPDQMGSKPAQAPARVRPTGDSPIPRPGTGD
jgi:hypothetical protein